MNGIAYTGIPSDEELKGCPGIPSEARIFKGRVAAIECIQHIACNPCVTACPFGAISMNGEITDLPVIDEEKCIGCGKCMSVCPGLAITMLDGSFSDDEITIDFPYEYLPYPKEGDDAEAVNRAGEVICKGHILKVMKPDANDAVRVIRMSVPKKYLHEVKSIKRLAGKETK